MKEHKIQEISTILEEIDNRPELATFFTRLEDDLHIRALFMLHPNDLFLSSEDFFLPVLFSVSNTDAKKSLLLSLISDLDNARSQKAYRSLPFFTSNTINIPKEFLDLIVYGAINLARKNDDIKALVTDDFSFAKMKKVLGNLDYDKIWDEVGSGINETDDPTLIQFKKELEALAKNWAKDLKSNLMKFLESLVDMMPNIYLAIHNDASSHIGSVLKKTDMSLKDYNQILSILYSLKLILRQDSVFRCDRCIDEPQMLRSSSIIGSNRMTIKCPRCGQKMNYTAILWLNESLREYLLDRDGLLAIAVAHMLKKRKVNFEFSVKDDKFEYDFICDTKKGKILVECKNHRFPESERSVEGSIEKDLQQASKHRDAIKLQSSLVIYNYDLGEYKDIVKKETKKYGVDLIGFSEAPNYFDSITKV